MKHGDDLIPEVYRELRKLARAYLAGDRLGQSLQSTELVHEVYLRLADAGDEPDGGWNNRGHFFGAAVRAMRRILVERARHKAAQKRPRAADRVDELATLPGDMGERKPSMEDVLALSRALERLEQAYPSKARLVRLRYIAGLTTGEVAEVMDMSVRTVERDWRFARAWLKKALAERE